MRKWHLAGALATVAAIPALASGCDPEPLGELVLIVKTDMAPPKDFNKLRIDVFNEGALKFSYEGPVPGDPGDSARVVLPSTLGLLAPEDPANSIRIEVGVRSGGKDGPVRIVREIVTTIPQDRVAMLNVPIQFLCKKDDIPFDNDGNLKPSDCPDGKTCIAGTCEDSVVDSTTLPDYDDDEVFGGSGDPAKGVCFDVQKCFTTTTLVDVAALDLDSCTFPLSGSVDPKTLNFALGVESDGICNSNGCFVALDANSETGWRLSDDGAAVVLPKGVCANLAEDKDSGLKVLQVVQASTSDDCPQKETKHPTCGPWSAVEPSSAPQAAPVAIAGAQDHPISVDLLGTPDGAFAYWTNRGSSSVKGTSVAGGSTISIDSAEPPRDIVATTDALFWTASTATGQGALYAYLASPPTGQEPLVQLQGMLTQPDGLAVRDSKVFWTEFLTPGRVFMGILAPDKASFTSVEAISSGNPYPARIVADNKFVYWTSESIFDLEDGTVSRVDHTKATPVQESLSSDPLVVPRAIALDLDDTGLATNLYFATLESPQGAEGKVWRVSGASSPTPGAPEVFAEGLAAPNGLAVDGTHVYIANRGNGTILYKRKDAPASEAPKVLATGQKNPGHILVSKGSLFWVNEGPSGVDTKEGAIVKFDLSKL